MLTFVQKLKNLVIIAYLGIEIAFVFYYNCFSISDEVRNL